VRRRIGFLFVLFLGAVLLSGCLFPTVITKEDDGRLVTLDKRDVLIVRLEGNPTTGYEWQLSARLDTGILEPVGDPEYISEGGGDIVGAGGTYVFKFRATGSGTIPLQFVYKRPWEDEPIDTFAVTVYVR